MSVHKLKFESPEFINNINSPQELIPKDWSYSGSTDELEVNVQTWNISCPNQEKIGKINTWYVNEDTFEFHLEQAEGFKKIDYVFAVSMITQICGKDETLAYLLQLQNIFEAFQLNKNIETPKEEPLKDDIDEQRKNE